MLIVMKVRHGMMNPKVTVNPKVVGKFSFLNIDIIYIAQINNSKMPDKVKVEFYVKYPKLIKR